MELICWLSETHVADVNSAAKDCQRPVPPTGVRTRLEKAAAPHDPHAPRLVWQGPASVVPIKTPSAPRFQTINNCVLATRGGPQGWRSGGALGKGGQVRLCRARPAMLHAPLGPRPFPRTPRSSAHGA